MDMRLRFPELLKASGLTPYAVAARSNGRIAPNTAYRLRKLGGRVRLIDAELLAALVDVFELDDMNDLFSRDDEAAPEPPESVKPARKRTAKRT